MNPSTNDQMTLEERDTPYHRNRYTVAATLDFFAGMHLVKENKFQTMPVENQPLPEFESSRALLPAPYWDGHEDAIKMYWHTWEMAFGNLKTPPSRMHVSNYIDTAFNGCLFLWDSVFILQFARYGSRVFDFQRTLDNLYATQLEDGFITRELRADGSMQFHPHDPASTGPNILGWSEWAHFQMTGDKKRLSDVFPVLLAYHRWMRYNRSWPDGSYFSCGLACGMDNMKRVPAGYEAHVHHGHLSWIDATAQAALSADVLIRMAERLGLQDQVVHEMEEYKRLSQWISERAWDSEIGFCCDVDRDGNSSGVKQVGGYWAMLAGLLDHEQVKLMAAHLDDPKSFKRHHRVPTLAADQTGYNPEGQYWNGSVWAPTTWMVLKSLERYGLHDMAFEIAENHHACVQRVWEETGTVWENYAPESDAPGKPAKPDFVGWTGLPPIAVLFEHLFGLRPDAPNQTLTWDVRQCDAFGVERYPYGANGVLDLHCAARESSIQEPDLRVSSNFPLELKITWPGGEKSLQVAPN